MPIFGATTITPAQAEAWARANGAHERFIAVIPIYFELAGLYEIPAENGLGQAAHETGYGHFKSVVPPSHHNWAGIKTSTGWSNTDPDHHQVFPDDRTGIEAHLQHLRRYGGRDLPAERELVDPRWHLVTKFTDSIEGLGGAWAPAANYGERVAEKIRALKATEAPMAGDDPRFAWVPDVSEYGYPKGNRQRAHPIELAIVHITAGVDSLGHLTGNNGSSAHYLTDRSFRPRVQMVPEAWAAWTAGNREYNERGINWEFEVRAHTPISDEQLRNAADTMRPRLIANNIPFVYLGRNAPLGTRGIIGHADVPDPDDPGKWGGVDNHVDPGEYWDWEKFIAFLKDITEPTPGVPVLPRAVPDPWRANNPWGREWWIPEPFVANINAGDWMSVGYCISEAFIEDGKIVQYFERARLEWNGVAVTRGLVGHGAMLARYPDRRWGA